MGWKWRFALGQVTANEAIGMSIAVLQRDRIVSHRINEITGGPSDHHPEQHIALSAARHLILTWLRAGCVHSV